jgi:hypothetical protein
MKLTFHKLHPNLDLQSCSEEIVYNGVDLDKFKFSIHKPGYNLVVLAHINYRKNPETWIQIIGKLKDLDNKYKLHVGGDFQDPLYKEYFEHIKKEMEMEDNFILHGWINEVEKFLEDKNYIISTSIHESFGYNIAEAMARGIKPIIHNFDGAKTLWPNELIYNTINEAVERITEQTYDSESYRRFIEDNYSLEEQIYEIEEILKINDRNRIKSQKNLLNNNEKDEDSNVINTNVSERNLRDEEKYENQYILEFYIYKELEKIEKKYKDSYIFLLSSHIGDIYATFSLLNAFKRKYNANKITVLIDKKFEFLVKMFPAIDNYVFIPAKYDNFITGYLGTIIGTRGPQIGKITIAHPKSIYRLARIYKLNFFDLFPLQLGLDINSSFELPTFYNCTNIKLKEHLSQMFIGKKIIYLFTQPRAMKLPKEFPEYLKKLLIMALESDYEFVFNELIDAKYFESFIPKDKMNKIHFLHVNLEDIIYVAEYFKNVVVFRNGIADLLTSAKVKMVVFYPAHYWIGAGYPIKMIDWWSLKKFKKRGQVLEMELINPDDAVYKTLEFFQNN